MPTSQQVIFQLRNVLTLSSDGSGHVHTYLAFDPSATTQSNFGTVAIFPDYTDITALFQRVKLLQFEVTMTPMLLDDVKGDSLLPLIIGSVASGTPSAPSSATTVSDNGDSLMWNPLRDYSGVAKYISRRISVWPGLPRRPQVVLHLVGRLVAS
jgi:hypothetical protein